MLRKKDKTASHILQPESGKWGTNLTWDMDADGTLTISGEGVMNEPSWVNEQRARAKKVIITEGITSIERTALYNFRNVTEVVLPESLEAMGKAVFEDCRSLTEVNFPESITKISSFLFFFCTGLKEITIPLHITEIDYGAFMNCSSLEKIVIPYTVTSIGDNVFRECNNLTIYGYPGTFAQLYASACGLPFEAIEDDTDHSLFPDLAADPANAYFKAVYWAVNKDILRGRRDGSLQPDAYCSRYQTATMLWRYAGRPKTQYESTFTDVNPDSIAYRAICWAQEKGIAEGFSDGTFRPSDTITRSQVCKMLWCWAGKPAIDNPAKFSDFTKDELFFDAVAWAYENNIIAAAKDASGQLIIKPNDTCQRQQVAELMYNFAKNIRKELV